MDQTRRDEGHIDLANGCRLYWQPNEAGGRTYYTDEVARGVIVWDTCSVSEAAIRAALAVEAEARAAGGDSAPR